VGSLGALDISGTAVKDIEPLRGAPLKLLNLSGTGVTNVAPLKGMALEDVRLTPNRITSGMEVLRAMKSLMWMGTGAKDTMAPYEFWQRYDSGEFKRMLD
jgi:hypothetical protein